MFRTIADLFLEGVAGLLAFFYDLPIIGGSYGGSIMMLTLTIMIFLMPLTIRATKSTLKMTQLQPKLKALQKKYKNDRQTLNVEVMALYKKNKINPVGGCLPILAQIPVFLILFSVIKGITRRISDLSFYGVSNHAWNEAAGTSGSALAGSNFYPDHLEINSKLYQDLRTHDEMNFGPIDLGAKPWDVIQSDFPRGILYVLLILFVVGTSYYQQRQIQGRRGSNAPMMNPTQQTLMRVLPLLSGVWGFVFPAGLVLYWATSNTFRIAQQAYITRSIYNKSDQAGSEQIDDDSEEEMEDENHLIEDKTSVNGSSREKAWAERRKQKAKIKPKKTGSANSSQQSSRTTPKGTKPTGTKKNRKR